MTVKERMLAIRLCESVRRQPVYACSIGITVEQQGSRSISQQNCKKKGGTK